MFRKKQSERMLTRKVWNYTIKTEKRFVLRKRERRCKSFYQNN